MQKHTQNLTVLLIGSGGRESAFLQKILESPLLKMCFFCGIPQFFFNEKLKIVEINIQNNQEILDFCRKNGVNFVIPCPEAILCNGIVDFLESNGILTFGPNKEASKLESSKIFMKDVLVKAGVPTAKYQQFAHTQFEHACEFIKSFSGKIVIKTDGLASGKGVYICENHAEAIQVLKEFFNGKFLDAGKNVVIEEFLDGKEVSVFAICDGKNAIPFFHACDYKKVFDGDSGLNTGGMGSFAPSFLENSTFQHIVYTYFKATLDELNKRNISFKGILFGGLIIKNNDVKFLEYNIRMGDPETQSILPLLESDILAILFEASNGIILDDIKFSNEHCVTVVLTSGGYPLDFEKNKKIFGVENVSCTVFPAGIKQVEDEFLTSGGRVLCVCAKSSTIEDARTQVYENIKKISFENMHFRNDIAK